MAYETTNEQICALRKVAYGLDSCDGCPVQCSMSNDSFNKLCNLTAAFPDAFPDVTQGESKETMPYEIIVDRGIPTSEHIRTDEKLKERILALREDYNQLTDDETPNYSIEVYKGDVNITHLIDFETGELCGCGDDPNHPLRAHCAVHGEKRP